MTWLMTKRVNIVHDHHALLQPLDRTPLKETSFLPQTKGMLEIESAFFYQPVLQNKCFAHSERKSSLFYNGLVVRDVSSNIKNCHKKPDGRSAGKICTIDNELYYLKVVETENTHPGRKTHALLGIHNLALIHHTIGIIVPSVFIAFEAHGVYFADEDAVAPASFYVASQSVDHFITAGALIQQVTRDHQIVQKRNGIATEHLELIKREQIVSKIGEFGLAELAVAGTLFQDLVNNDGNWGYNTNGLVIVDVDNSPSSFEEYLSEAVRVPQNIELSFSVETILNMKRVYLNMLTKGLPVIDDSVDMSGSFYQTLIQAYIDACDKTLLTLAKDHPDLPMRKPTNIVNRVLSDGFLNVMACAREHGFFAAYPRYKTSSDPDMARPHVQRMAPVV
jgi:hypothetical protein